MINLQLSSMILLGLVLVVVLEHCLVGPELVDLDGSSMLTKDSNVLEPFVHCLLRVKF
ncbi:unnamed protein product [Ilex paraguariensis]|uniref:Uncharacterized protein n=1 Tax=Ilex paraguariensis TaxID=185542 RepID=A0ABC8RRR7_9AQUA